MGVHLFRTGVHVRSESFLTHCLFNYLLRFIPFGEWGRASQENTHAKNQSHYLAAVLAHMYQSAKLHA
jgi:hypothetical protein